MWQMYAAKAALDFMGGLMSAGKADVQATNEATMREAQNEDAWLNNTAENKALAEANVQNTIRTAYRVGILNLQQGQVRMRQAGLGIGLNKAKMKALSAENVNAAATGTIGSSVDAVVSDIEMQAENADASIVRDKHTQETNYTMQLMDVLQAGEDALRDPTKVRIRKVKAPERTRSGEVLLNSLIGTASSYASSYMSSGFGQAGSAGGGGGGSGEFGGGGTGASMDGMGEGFEGMS